MNIFTYYSVWQNVLENLIKVNDKFDEKIIVTNIDHFTGSYSINDILPFNNVNGSLDMTCPMKVNQSNSKKKSCDFNITFLI